MAYRGWNYRIAGFTVTNDGITAGNQTYTLTAAALSEVEIFQIDTTNLDTVGRNVSITLGPLTILAASSLNAAATTRAPYVGGAFAAAGNNPDLHAPYHLGNALALTVTVAAVAISQDSSCIMLYRWRGAAPTLAAGGPAGSTAVATAGGASWVETP